MRMIKFNMLIPLALLTAFICACQKEEVAETDSKESTKNQIMAPPGGGVVMTKIDVRDPVEFWCQEPVGSCFPPVIIFPEGVDVFEEYIEEGPSGVREYFLNEDLWVDLFPVLVEAPDYLDKLQSGNYGIEPSVEQEGGTFIWRAVHVDNEEDYFALTGAYNNE